jgi:hypothetical protein
MVNGERVWIVPQGSFEPSGSSVICSSETKGGWIELENGASVRRNELFLSEGSAWEQCLANVQNQASKLRAAKMRITAQIKRCDDDIERALVKAVVVKSS